MKKEKSRQPRRPATQNNSMAKRVDPDMFSGAAPQKSQQRQRPNPKVFDQTVQPIQRQQQKKQGMKQVVLPVSPPQPPSPQMDNEGQAQKRRRKPQKAEKRLTRGEARRRKFKKQLIAFIIIAFVIAAGAILSVSFLFKIEAFYLDGTSTYSQQDIELAFGIPTGENIFSFKIDDVEKKMSAALPYAETVTVHRRLPNTVVFKTTQAVESYYTECVDGGYAVLSKNLKVLRLSKDPPQDLLLISGVDALLPKAGNMLESSTQGKMDSVKRVIEAIEAEGLEPFNTLDVSNVLEISFIYDKRAKVLLGTSNDLENKLALVGVILKDKIGKFEKGTLDVSYKSPEKDRQGIWQPGNI